MPRWRAALPGRPRGARAALGWSRREGGGAVRGGPERRRAGVGRRRGWPRRRPQRAPLNHRAGEAVPATRSSGPTASRREGGLCRGRGAGRCRTAQGTGRPRPRRAPWAAAKRGGAAGDRAARARPPRVWTHRVAVRGSDGRLSGKDVPLSSTGPHWVNSYDYKAKQGARAPTASPRAPAGPRYAAGTHPLRARPRGPGTQPVPRRPRDDGGGADGRPRAPPPAAALPLGFRDLNDPAACDAYELLRRVKAVAAASEKGAAWPR
jgi:hypothetical protein